MRSRKWTWKLLLFFGLTPFLLAFGFCFVTSLLDSGGGGMFPKTSFWDYLILWSFLYWPSYVIGMALIALSAVLRRKHHDR